MIPVTIDTVAESLYRAYGDEALWKNFQGQPMPHWDQLPDHIRKSWKAVAREAHRLHVAGYLALVEPEKKRRP